MRNKDELDKTRYTITTRIWRCALAAILALSLSCAAAQPLSTVAYATPPEASLTPLALDNVGYITGATPIGEGMAVGANDITIYNENLAFSLAISSNNFWNMTKGSILDIAPRTGDTFGKDLVNDVEFLNDLWTATGRYSDTDLLSDITVDPVVVAPNSVSVTIHTRYWVADADKDGVEDLTQFGSLQEPLNVALTYELASGADYITLTTSVENPLSNQATYTSMYAGYSISTLGAKMFGPFGFYPDVKTTGIGIGADPAVSEYFGNYVATYGSDYAVMLWMEGADSYKGSSGYKDLYDLQDYAPGVSAVFDGEVLVSDTAATAGIMDRYIAHDPNLAAAVTEVSGTVTDRYGAPIANASVIIEKQGVYLPTDKSGMVNGNPPGTAVGTMQPLIWAVTDALGNYTLKVPNNAWVDPTADVLGNNAASYNVKVEAAGYTSVEAGNSTFTGSSSTGNDFTLQGGAPISLTAVDEKGTPIPFKVTVTSGLTSRTYFSNTINSSNDINFSLSQADGVTFTASYGGGSESSLVSITRDVGPEGLVYEFVIPTEVDPEAAGWYCSDNHQHSNMGDASTTPEDLINAQIAAKLDFCIVTDHDSAANNGAVSNYASGMGTPFISGIEASPGWGHWNLIGLPANYSYTLNPSTVTPQQIVAHAHSMEGVVLSLNHPYSDYGFLNNQASVSGGFDEGWDSFDLLELQSSWVSTDFIRNLGAGAIETVDLNNLKSTIQTTGITQMDQMALVTAFAFWNNGDKKYLNAGSDQHDASSSTLYPGIIRSYCLLDPAATTTADYLAALMAGNSYVTMGPILQPDTQTSLFGSTYGVNVGEVYTLSFDAGSVNGDTEVTLWGNGVPLQTKTVGAISGGALATVEFEVTPFIAETSDPVWYSITATDAARKDAASNPIWFISNPAATNPGDNPGEGGSTNNPAQTGDTGLARTGDTVTPLVIVGVLLVVGLGALVLRRRFTKNAR